MREGAQQRVDSWADNAARDLEAYGFKSVRKVAVDLDEYRLVYIPKRGSKVSALIAVEHTPDGPKLIVNNISSRPKGKGYSAQAVRQLIEWAHAHKIKQISVITDEPNVDEEWEYRTQV
jgi:hypothetical protein